MKLPIKVSEDSKEPIYHQIETQIKALIIGGQLSPGTLLPSIRVLSHALACSVITTRRAYQNLEHEGFIKTVQGKGTFVSELDKKMEEEAKHNLVYKALEKAIEQGAQMGCSIHDIRKIFDRVVNNQERK